MQDNRITLPKAQNTKNHPTETFLLKGTFLRNNLQHIHDQFAVSPIDKDNGNAAFICKRFYMRVLIKELGIGLGGTSSNNDNCNMHGIDDHLSINQHSKCLQKKFKAKVSQDNKMLPSI